MLVTFSELPWHCYNKKCVTALLAPLGKVLYLDATSVQKTRGSLAKVRLQLDLTKDRPPQVWTSFDEDNLTIGRSQLVQCEGILGYCHYCKHKGHIVQSCTIKRRDDEHKRRKKMDL